MCGSCPGTVINIAEPVVERDLRVSIIAFEEFVVQHVVKVAKPRVLLAFDN